MKKIVVFLLVSVLFMVAGCKKSKKDVYLPEAKNDKIYTTIGGGN